MLIVLAVTTIILLAINMVFTNLSAAVSLGSGQSQVLAAGRAVSDYLYDDFKHMVGPGNGGFLIIINRQVTGVTLIPTDYNPTTGTNIPSIVRDDQLIFIRDRVGLNPICPPVNGVSAAPNPASNAPYLRVCYGHGSEYAGQYAAAPPTNFYYGPGPFTNFPGGSALATVATATNFACQWVLARQALFLNGSPASDLNLALVANNPLASGGNANLNIARGLTDNVRASLAALDTYLRPATSVPGDAADTYIHSNNPQCLSFLGNPILVRRLPYAYYNGATAPGTNSVDAFSTATGNNYTDFSPNIIAQTHAYFVGSVSDFIVDFAACTAGVASPTNPGEADFQGAGSQYQDGGTQWYGLSTNSGQDGVLATNYPLGAGKPALAWQRYNPYTQVLDPAVALQKDNLFAFEHGDVGRRDGNGSGSVLPVPKSSAWPYLIRVRYRVHDPAGKIVGADGLPGRLFEQVLYVNRN